MATWKCRHNTSWLFTRIMISLNSMVGEKYQPYYKNGYTSTTKYTKFNRKLVRNMKKNRTGITKRFD